MFYCSDFFPKLLCKMQWCDVMLFRLIKMHIVSTFNFLFFSSWFLSLHMHGSKNKRNGPNNYEPSNFYIVEPEIISSTVKWMAPSAFQAGIDFCAFGWECVHCMSIQCTHVPVKKSKQFHNKKRYKACFRERERAALFCYFICKMPLLHCTAFCPFFLL